MAIEKFENKASVNSSDLEGLFLGLSNSDLEALEQAIKKWDFKDEESFLKFVIAIMIKSGDDKNLFITDKEGHKINMSPSDDLLNPPPTT